MLQNRPTWVVIWINQIPGTFNFAALEFDYNCIGMKKKLGMVLWLGHLLYRIPTPMNCCLKWQHRFSTCYHSYVNDCPLLTCRCRTNSVYGSNCFIQNKPWQVTAKFFQDVRLGSSRENIKHFKDLKVFQSSTPQNYCIGILMNKTKAKQISGLSQVNVFQCSFFQLANLYSLANLIAVFFSWTKGCEELTSSAEVCSWIYSHGSQPKETVKLFLLAVKILPIELLISE